MNDRKRYKPPRPTLRPRHDMGEEIMGDRGPEHEKPLPDDLGVERTHPPHPDKPGGPQTFEESPPPIPPTAPGPPGNEEPMEDGK